MNVGVIGSRGFNDYEKVKEVLSKITITKIISGGAKGADSLGKKYAEENNIPFKIYLPDWDKYKKKAGFIRNTNIVEDSELIVAFWDGASRGTKDSLDKARKLNKSVMIINI